MEHVTGSSQIPSVVYMDGARNSTATPTTSQVSTYILTYFYASGIQIIFFQLIDIKKLFNLG